MTPEELQDYAGHLVLEHARDVEFLSVFEMYEDYAGEDDAEISDEDARKVLDLIREADITITWPEDDASTT